MRVLKKCGYVLRDNTPKGDEPIDRELERFRKLYLKSASELQMNEDEDILQKLYGGITGAYTSALSLDERVPSNMRSRFASDMRSWSSTMASGLAKTTFKAFDSASNPSEAMGQITSATADDMERLSNILSVRDKVFRACIALSSDPSYTRYLFLSERTSKSCERCESNHGRVMSERELESENLIPPLHPNCKCQLIEMDNAAEYLYNLNRDGFTGAIDDAIEGSGGVFRLDHSAAYDGITSDTIRRLGFPISPAITDGEHKEPNWYDGLMDWAVKFGTDAVNFIDAYFNRGQELAVHADEAMYENPALGIALWVDWVALGIPSGFLEGVADRYARWQNDPGLYNFVNRFTFGLPDIIQGTVFPEEPMSFEHFMNALSLTTIVYGAYKVIATNPAIDSTDDLIRAGDTNRRADSVLANSELENIARQDGRIVKATSADKLNAAAVANGYSPPYALGTNVYQIELDEATQFVRVFDGIGSSITGSWVMRAEDIAGLTAQQIRDKYALPNIPKYICDVSVPAGTNISVSVANRVAGWGNGGGIQYSFYGYVDYDTWFTNKRALP